MNRDHVYICVSVPPKYSVSSVVGYMKGKCAIVIAKNFRGKQRSFNGDHFCTRGCFVSTVGLDEDVLRAYIRDQEKNESSRDQHNLDW